MFGIGPMELVLILVVALLVLGPKRMPELARTLGKGLSEFRRASHDLRQSLALDEIQNELRDGLTGAGSIHKPVKKPEADDKPPQAGDDLASGEGANEGGEGAESDEGVGAKHPGELPEDLDPYAHKDAAHKDAQAADDSDGTPPAEEAPRATPDPAADPAPSTSPADDGLGTVPVGRTATPRRAAEPAAPVPATPPPSTTDDERG